ncbi:MAG: DUF2147 domain-containing protein [Pseudolabrys sp.]
MLLRLRHAVAAAFAACALAAPVANAEDGPSGMWRVEDGKALIRIVDCGGQYWGVVAWEQTPGTDSKNPNPALRSRPTLGMPVLLALKADHQGEWRGHIYNAEDGQTYDSHVKMAGAGRLRVEGCVMGIMCGGETWSRAGAPAVAESVQRAPAHATTGAGRARRSVATETPAQVCSGLGRR